MLGSLSSSSNGTVKKIHKQKKLLTQLSLLLLLSLRHRRFWLKVHATLTLVITLNYEIWNWKLYQRSCWWYRRCLWKRNQEEHRQRVCECLWRLCCSYRLCWVKLKDELQLFLWLSMKFVAFLSHPLLLLLGIFSVLNPNFVMCESMNEYRRQKIPLSLFFVIPISPKPFQLKQLLFWFWAV